MRQKTKINLSDIEILVNQGESNNLEFKTSTANLHSVCETLCGFLNGNGGMVLIGVKNNGKIVGQDVSDNTRLEIANFFSKLEPPVSVDVAYVIIEKQKCVIKMAVTANPSAIPYVFDGKPYWRVESQTKPMPQHRYHQLLVERTNKTDGWELTKAKHISIDDLDQIEIFNTINKSIEKGRMKASLATDDPHEALLRLNLLVNGSISNAAVVLFCQDSMPYYPQCLLRLFKFKGVDKSDLIDSKRVYGNAFVLLSEAENFLMRHMSVGSEFIQGKMARKDIPEYSSRAVREAVVNGICHRDYSIKGGSISLMIYSDRLEVTSHGTLPFGVTIAQLKRIHESSPRNDRITNVMYRRGIIESAGNGTQEMIKECKIIDAPEPEYFERDNTFTVQFRSNSIAHNLGVMSDISSRQKEILAVMASLIDECTTSQILSKMKSNVTDRTLRNDLVKLENLGFVLRRGEGRGTLWKLQK